MKKYFLLTLCTILISCTIVEGLISPEESTKAIKKAYEMGLAKGIKLNSFEYGKEIGWNAGIIEGVTRTVIALLAIVLIKSLYEYCTSTHSKLKNELTRIQSALEKTRLLTKNNGSLSETQIKEIEELEIKLKNIYRSLYASLYL